MLSFATWCRYNTKTFLNIRHLGERMVNVIFQQPYLWSKILQYPLDRRLCAFPDNSMPEFALEFFCCLQSQNVSTHFFLPAEISTVILYSVTSGTVTTAWRVLRLRMEKRPPDTEGSCQYINKQSRTADKGWSSS